MADYQTSTRKLLVDLGRILKSEVSNRLRSVLDVRIGVIRTPPQFPVIALIPVARRIKTLWNGYADVTHSIRFDVYTSKLDAHSAFNQAVGIINSLKTIFKPGYNETGHQVPELDGTPTVCSTSISDERFSEIIEYNGTLLQYALLQIDFVSQAPFYGAIQPLLESQWRFAQAKELMEVVSDTLKLYKNSALMKVQSFKTGVLPPQATFPLVYTTTDEVSTNPMFTSADVEENDIKVLVITKLLDNEEALLDNVEIADAVLNILNANSYFGGRVIHTNFPAIDYGQIDVNQALMYGSTLTLRAHVVRTFAN